MTDLRSFLDDEDSNDGFQDGTPVSMQLDPKPVPQVPVVPVVPAVPVVPVTSGDDGGKKKVKGKTAKATKRTTKKKQKTVKSSSSKATKTKPRRKRTRSASKTRSSRTRSSSSSSSSRKKQKTATPAAPAAQVTETAGPTDDPDTGKEHRVSVGVPETARVDTDKDVSPPATLDLTASVTHPKIDPRKYRSDDVKNSEEATSETSKNTDRPAPRKPMPSAKIRKLRGVDPKQPSVPRCSETVAAMRDAARAGVPPDAAERVVAVHNVSYLSTDPTRKEEKATLVALASGPGEPVTLSPEQSADEPQKRGKKRKTPAKKATDTAKKATKTSKKKKKGTSSTRAPRKKRARKTKTSTTTASGTTDTTKSKTVEVHRLDQLPPKETWPGVAPSTEPSSTLPEVREIGKHPGEIKTAAPGVAIPPPGHLDSGLRKKLQASNLTQSPVQPDREPVDTDEWETNTPQQVAQQLDARRMVVNQDDLQTKPVRPLSELSNTFADADRLSESDARTRLLQYMTGLVERQVLEIDYAAKLVWKNMQRKHQTQPTEPTAQHAAKAVPRKTRKGTPRTLVLDATEEEILQVMCGTDHDAAAVANLPQPPLSDQEEQVAAERQRTASLQNALPNVGLGAFLDMPLDAAEIALTTSATLPEALIYFMSFDDSVTAVERVYQTVVRLAGLPEKMDALRKVSRPYDLSNDTFAAMLSRLRAFEKELADTWKTSTTTASAEDKNPVSELWIKLNAVRVLIAVMSGKIDDQRLNVVRYLVAMEDSLMNGLYREPSMRCFQQQQQQQSDENNPAPDLDVLNAIRAALCTEPANGDGDVGSSASLQQVRLSLPKLGEPATKDYCRDFLRPRDPDQPLERPCIRGERGCVAWMYSAHASFPSTGGLNRAPHAFVMREFFPADQWEKIRATNILPTKRRVCLMCARFTATFHWIQLRLLDTRAVTGVWADAVRNKESNAASSSHQKARKKTWWQGTLLGQSHCNAIEPEHGYTEADMLPVWKPTDGPWAGIVQPIVAFRANSYIPGECVPPIDAASASAAVSAADGSGGGGAHAASDQNGQDAARTQKTLPCFYEVTASDFH